MLKGFLKNFINNNGRNTRSQTTLSKTGTNSFKKYIPLIVLTLLPLIFFYKAFLGNIIFSGDFSGSDLTDFYYPIRHKMFDTLSRGQLPLWEPNLAMGFPLVAEGQLGAFYPLNFLFILILPPPIALNASILAIFFISLFSTYFYLKLLNRSSSSSLFGAVVFSFSAFFIARFKHLDMATIASLFPLLMLLTKLYFKTLKIRFALFTGLTIASILVAGHHQMAFYTLLTYLSYLFFETFRIYRFEKQKEVILNAVFFGFIAFIIGIGLSLIQLMPAAELLKFSERQSYEETTITAYPYDPKNLITFISPYYFGNPANGSYKESLQQTGVFWENASYIGLLPLFFAFFWLLRTFIGKDRDPYTYYFIALGIVSLLLMLGRFTPLFLTLSKIIPLFGLFRFPTRFNLFLIFSLALLSSKTFDFFLNKLKQNAGKVLIFSVLAVTLLDLFLFASVYISYLPIDIFSKKPEITKQILEDKSLYRTYSQTQYDQSPYTFYGWKNIQAILGIRQAMPPNDNLIWNINSFTDRTWFEGGFSLSKRNKLEEFLLYENKDNPLILGKILGIFNVKYIISFKSSLGIEINKISEYDLGPYFASKLYLFKNNQYLERAFFVPEAEVIKGEESIFKKLADPSFLPTRTVILEEQPDKIPGQFIGILDNFIKDNPVKIASYRSSEVLIDAELKNSGFLVLTDINYPGWKAEVDGRNKPILTADYIGRALELAPGKHKIRFYYDPLPFKIGALISLLTLISIIVISVWQFRKKPKV